MILKESEFNKECECGTGLKFGECCGKVLIQMAAEAAYREKFPSPPLISTKFGKYRARAVWNKIHFRPITEHLHEFIVKVLIRTLGKSWCKARRKKVPEEQHIIMRCVYHQEGDLSDLSIIKTDIFSLYNEAMLQNPSDMPFGVFIDINLPSQRDRATIDRDWIKNLLQKIEQEGKSVFRSPPPAFVGITNSGWFYEGKSPAGRGESLAFVLQDAAHPLKIPLTIEALFEALKLFSIIPDEDV